MTDGDRAVGVAAVLERRYVDSVVAMRLARDLAAAPGVLDAAALMATPPNRALLATGAFGSVAIPPCGPDDLLVVVLASSETAARDALASLPARLRSTATAPVAGAPRTLDEAVERLPASTLVSISVPGEHAAAEARHALEGGRHVFCFSSGVALADEVELKALAARKGLLCMGPDCGTAILGGVGLGFANAVRRGPVGVIGASGTGIQAVTSLLDLLGIGTSHAIGAGSRDLDDRVGASTTLAALRALDEDPATELVIVVSKPGDKGPTDLVRKAAAAAATPVVVCVLGDEDADARTIDDAVALAAARLGRTAGVLGSGAPDARALPPRGARRRVRGLFSGGSLCAEAQVVLRDAGLEPSSNAPLPGVPAIDDGDVLEGRLHGDALVDLGTARFTQGRPHPMIDARARVVQLGAAAADDDVAVVLLDVVLGYNAAPDPAGDLEAAIASAVGSGVTVIASVVGTEADPQRRGHQVATLRRAGAAVAPTNAAAAALAASAVAGSEP